MEEIDSPFDVFALTPTAMCSLDRLKISYKNSEDFYNKKSFVIDASIINNETELIFEKLDKVCEDYIDFPYSYSSQINYFLHVFLEMLFLENLCKNIEKQYDKIYLVTDINITKIPWDEMTYNDLKSHPESESLSLQKHVSGINNKIKILQDILNCTIINIGEPLSASKNLKTKHNFIFDKLKKNIDRVMRYADKGFKLVKIAINKRLKKVDSPIFIIQDGFEITFLKNYMQGYNFINPTFNLRKRMPIISSVKYDINQIKLIVNPFLLKHWNRLSPYIESLIITYHREVVGRIAAFINSFENECNYHNPKAMIYSVGTRDVLDAITTYIANQKHIPVVYFQHGGTQIFHNSIFQKYVETDKKVKKTLIMDSTFEKEHIDLNSSSNIAFGSINKYRMMKNQKKTSNEKILYLSGSFPHSLFRCILNGTTDIDYYKISNNILVIANNLSLKMDIKLHPIEKDYQYKYYANLIKVENSLNSNIIINDKAESIMNNYGLLILDMVGTAVLPSALLFKVPIILYLKDNSIINNTSRSDLMKRCYIVNDKISLTSVLNKFKKGDLPSKWSKEIINRYIYPMDKGDPGKNISDYLKSI